MRNRFEDLEAVARQLIVEELGRPRAECRILVHDHHRLRRFAGLVVDGDKVVQCGLGDNAETGAEAEGILQAASDDAVDHTDIHDVRQIVARSRLACRQAYRACIAADHRADAGLVHFLDFGIAPVRRRLSVPKHRIDLGAAQRFDAASRVNVCDRQRSAKATLLPGIRQRAGHRMQDADFDRSALRAEHSRSLQQCRARGRSQSGRL